MGTFAQAQDRINLDYLNRTDLTNETKRALIRAVKHYEKERFWFNMTATAVALNTAGTPTPVPADFLALNFVTVLDVTGGSVDNVVTIRSLDRIAYQNRTKGSGVAQEVAYWNDALWFYPARATSAYAATIHYTHALPVLSADSDTNGWLSAAEDLIVHHAAADMLANVLRSDPAQVQAHKTWEMEAYKLLQFGNQMRMREGFDLGMQGSQHNQAQKQPNDLMPGGPGVQGQTGKQD